MKPPPIALFYSTCKKSNVSVLSKKFKKHLEILINIAFLVTEVGATPGVIAALLTSIAAEILAFDTITVIRLGLGNGNGRKGSDSQKNANFCHCRFLFSLLESFSELFLRHQINLPHSFQIFD